MNTRIFLNEIEKELGKGAEAERFHEEIRDHLDDSLNDPINTHTQEEATQSLGEPSLLSSSFHSYSMQKNFFVFLSEVLFVSILSTPLFLVLFMAVYMGTQDVMFSDPSVALTIPSTIITSGVAVIVSLSLLALLYLTQVPRIFVEFPFGTRHIPWIAGLFGLPLGMLCFLLIDMLGSRTTDFQAIILTFVTIFLLVAVVPFFYGIQRARTRTQTKHRTRERRQRLSTFFGGSVLLYILMHRILLWTIVHSPALEERLFPQTAGGPPLLMVVLMPLTFFEMFGLNLLSSTTTLHIFWTHVGYRILGVLLVVLIISSGIQVVRALRSTPRRLSWTHSIVAIYALSLLTLGPLTNTSPNITVPSAKISEIIERQQLGPFYRMTKYLNSFEAFYGQYLVLFRSGQFVIEQTNGGQTFLLNSGSDVQHFSLEKAPKDFQTFTFFPTDNIPFECRDSSAPNEFSVSDYTCKELTYKGKTIFTMPEDNRLWMKTAAVSDDGQWAVIVVTQEVDTVNEVYLLDLRSLQ